jgi:hypothetical protein
MYLVIIWNILSKYKHNLLVTFLTTYTMITYISYWLTTFTMNTYILYWLTTFTMITYISYWLTTFTMITYISYWLTISTMITCISCWLTTFTMITYISYWQRILQWLLTSHINWLLRDSSDSYSCIQMHVIIVEIVSQYEM